MAFGPHLLTFCLNVSYIVLKLIFYNLQRYWSGSGVNKNKAMVEHLQHYGVITSKKVSEVMETIDRACFVPDGSPPYVDSPMAIGYNATISAPHMHATCLQLLEENLKPGMHALDIGSGIFPLPYSISVISAFIVSSKVLLSVINELSCFCVSAILYHNDENLFECIKLVWMYGSLVPWWMI